MQDRMIVHSVSISVLVAIGILASFALVAELLPEVEAKVIVIPTLLLIVGWIIFFLISVAKRK